jgi:hypothetical protein
MEKEKNWWPATIAEPQGWLLNPLTSRRSCGSHDNDLMLIHVMCGVGLDDDKDGGFHW